MVFTVILTGKPQGCHHSIAAPQLEDMATSGSLIILRSGRISVLVQGAFMPGITFLMCTGEIVSAIRRGAGSSRATIHAPLTVFPGKSGSAVGIICTLQFAPVL